MSIVQKIQGADLVYSLWSVRAQLMKDHGVMPDVKSFTLGMDICLRQGLWQVALKIIDFMRAVKVVPDGVSYAKAIAAAHLGTTPSQCQSLARGSDSGVGLPVVLLQGCSGSWR
jgi:hypothetical protein